MVSSQKLNPLLLPEPEPCMNHALTLTSATLIPYMSLGEKGRKSVPGSKLVPEICHDKHMRKSRPVYNMAAECSDWGGPRAEGNAPSSANRPSISPDPRGEWRDTLDKSLGLNQRGENNKNKQVKPIPTQRWAGSSPPGSTRLGGSVWFCHWGAWTSWASHQSHCPTLKTPWAHPPQKSCSVWSASSRAGGRSLSFPGNKRGLLGRKSPSLSLYHNADPAAVPQDTFGKEPPPSRPPAGKPLPSTPAMSTTSRGDTLGLDEVGVSLRPQCWPPPSAGFAV